MDKPLTTQDECTKIIVKFKHQALQSTPLVLEEEKNILTQGHDDFFSSFSGLEFNRLIFTVSPEDMIQDLKTYNLPEDLSLFRYYSVKVSKEQGDPQSIVDRLKQSPLVETAYIELPYVEFDGPDSFFTMEDLTKHEGAYAQPDRNPLSYKQGYLKAAPLGIDAHYGWNIPGGEGEGITFVDIEYGWLLDHEDLVEQKIELIPGGINEKKYQNHGTAVLGEVVGTDNEIGIIGASPKALAKVSPYSRQSGYSLTEAIMTAALVMKPGDVLLIELQNGSPVGYVPVETNAADFDAIKYATNKGITVVEPGANGSVNLDTFTKDGKYIFNRNSPDFKDSGAIVVGAGSSTVPHKRLNFSDYGSRIDVYAWGENVTTTYSNDNNSSVKNLYTNYFSGTSSASPIIAGAVVNLQGIAKAKLGRPFTPEEVRDLLSDPDTGTPSNNPSSDRIGVMPDLKRILNKLEIYPNLPTAPTGLRVTDIQANRVTLQWNPSESNIGIKGYDIYRNNTLIERVFSSTEFKDRGLATNTEYRYTVKAVDRNGNVSYGTVIKVKTKHMNLEGNQFVWSMRGYNDDEFARIDFNKNQENMQIQLRSGTPHPDFNETYASITVRNSSGEVMHEKDIYGNKYLDHETNYLLVKVGDFIVLKHKEGESRATLMNVDHNEQESLGTWIAYEVTNSGFKPLLGLEATDIQTNYVGLQWSPESIPESMSGSADLWYYVYRNDRNGHIGGSKSPDFGDTLRLEANTEYRYRVKAVIDDNFDDPVAVSNEIKVKTKSYERETDPTPPKVYE
ncbi:putative mucin/carbohydrate-binding domain-containing protein [Paenibacillus larvae]